MKVISTNLGKSTTFVWNGKQERTGIFKHPVKGPISLEKDDVLKDTVIDRKHHGGKDKACYLFSTAPYPHWKNLYPKLRWDWGMFGENLTIKGLDESKIRIGNIYSIGTAVVQVSQPREPCYKLGIRFGDQGILRQFIAYGYPGTYVRIIKEGEVKKGDTLDLVEESPNSLTVKQFFDFLYKKEKDSDILALLLSNNAVPKYKQELFKKTP